MLHVLGSQQQTSKKEMLQKLQSPTETLDAMKKDVHESRKEAIKRDEQIRPKVSKVRIHLVDVYLTLLLYLNGNSHCIDLRT